MSYKISFRAKLDGINQWVYVGNSLNHTSNTSSMIEEVCGSYPSEWHNKKCADLYPVLIHGISQLKRNPQEYRRHEPSNGWGTVETTINFLSEIADNCNEYPTAIVEVSH